MVEKESLDFSNLIFEKVSHFEMFDASFKEKMTL